MNTSNPNVYTSRRYQMLPILLLLFFFVAVLSTSTARATCSTYAGKASFNEYYFGNDPNFLEIFIKNISTIPEGDWQGWTIRVYTSSTVWTDYVLDSLSATPSATYCPFGSKAFVTVDVPAGLPSTTSTVAVALLDATGNEIDYLKACGTPGTCTLPTFYTPDPAVCNATIDHDIILSSMGNRDLSRFPDGSGNWAISGGTGSGSSYTSCTSNLAGIAKVASVPSVEIGSDFTFTIDALNSDKKDATFIIEDSIPAGFTYVSSSATQGDNHLRGSFVNLEYRYFGEKCW